VDTSLAELKHRDNVRAELRKRRHIFLPDTVPLPDESTGMEETWHSPVPEFTMTPEFIVDYGLK
jgi:hypothetical protein